MLKQNKIWAFIFLLIIAGNTTCNFRQDENIQKQLFDLNWKFLYGDNKYAAEADFDDQDWRSLDLPHDWNKDMNLKGSLSGNDLESGTIEEVGWYRKYFEIPPNWSGKSIQIVLEGISKQHKIFVNGTMIENSGKRKTAYQTVLNPYLNENSKNVIAIRVVVANDSENILSTEAGIFNHVWLLISDTRKN